MSDEDKSGMPDTQYAGGDGNQDATQVGFSHVILCWYWPAGVSLAALMLLSCLPAHDLNIVAYSAHSSYFTLKSKSLFCIPTVQCLA